MKRILLVVVSLLGLSSVADPDGNREKLRRFEQNNFEVKRTEESFMGYVSFLIQWGREDNYQLWLDEASVLVGDHDWKSSQKKLRIERELHMSKAAFLPLIERSEYLLENNNTNTVIEDSYSVVLRVTQEQVENFKNGNATPSSIFTKEEGSYLERDLDNKLHYLEIILTHGKAVYYVDNIFLDKVTVLLNEIRLNPLACDDVQFHALELQYHLINRDYCAASTKLKELGRMSGNKESVERVIAQYLILNGTKDEFEVSGNLLENFIVLIDQKKGSADEFKNRGKNTAKSSTPR